MNNILEVLNNQVGFLIALVIGVIARTIGGAMKHKQDFNWKKLIDGAIDFTMILSVIVLVIIGINMYEPLFLKYGEEVETLKTAILFIVYGNAIVYAYQYFNVKDEDMQEAKKYIDTQNYGEVK